MRNDKKAAEHLRRVRKELAAMLGYGDDPDALSIDQSMRLSTWCDGGLRTTHDQSDRAHERRSRVLARDRHPTRIRTDAISRVFAFSAVRAVHLHRTFKTSTASFHLIFQYVAGRGQSKKISRDTGVPSSLDILRWFDPPPHAHADSRSCFEVRRSASSIHLQTRSGGPSAPNGWRRFVRVGITACG